LKSQFPEEALLEESEGTVINLSYTMRMGSEGNRILKNRRHH